MPLLSNLNVKPYYDDFDENKKYLRILFKPGYSVQARELTQIQTILQNQIEKFGNNIFTNGTPIVGAKTHTQNLISLKINSLDIDGNGININEFLNKTIYGYEETVTFSNGTPSSDPISRSSVIAAAAENIVTTEAPILLVQNLWGTLQDNSKYFKKNQYLKIIADDGLPRIVQILNLDEAVGVGQAFSIDEGVFYYGGFFIKNDAQSIVVDKYSTTSASVKIGFEIQESFYSSNDDATLFDPAQDSTNYQAPGADRYFVDLVLSTRSLDATDNLENFIELARYSQGQLQKIVKTTVYNKIGDEMAKRTFEESGNYVVSQFNAVAQANTIDSTKYDILVDPGKAYVKGYAVDVDFPQKISIDAARDISPVVVDKRLNGSYGSYFYTTNHANNFGTTTNSLIEVDLHCVDRGNINTDFSYSISNTKIGTARVKSQEFVAAGNTQVGSTYIYSTDLFDINVSSITSTVKTGTTANAIVFGTDFSKYEDAYTGASLRIISGPGSGERPKIITNYNGTTRTANVFPDFITTPTTASTFSIDFNVRDVQSLIVLTGTTTIANSANISSSIGITPETFYTTRDSILFDSTIEESIFNIGSEYIAPGTITSVTYPYTQVFSGTLSGGSLTINSPSADTFASSSNEEDIRFNYKLVCKSPGGSTYTAGQVIPSNVITITGGGTTSITLSVTGGVAMVFDLLATLYTTSGPKVKNLISANTSNVDPSPVTVTSGVYTSNSYSQVIIDASSVVAVPDTRQKLYLNDVIKLVKVLDFTGNNVTDANIQYGIDVTDKYVLDNGQRDSYYDNASILLKAGNPAPIGPILVMVDRYLHPTNAYGFFSVDSYPFYANVSTYTSSSGKFYQLRDALDFRPAVVEETATKSFNIPSSGAKIVKRNGLISLGCKNYLPRIDKLTLSSDGIYQIKKGISSDFPSSPKVDENSISLYEIRLNPYTANVSDVNLFTIPNKRYTMKDIGVLENRIKNLEYYSTLSLLENDALSKSDVSLYGRTKNGILTDSFVDFSMVDAESGDFIAAIDDSEFTENELRPSIIMKSLGLLIDEDNSTNFSRKGSLVFIKSTDQSFVQQPYATTAISVNPYNVQLFLGSMKLNPKSDVWIDTTRMPAVKVSDPSTDTLSQLIDQQNKELSSVQWSSWQWLGNPPARGKTGTQTRTKTITSYTKKNVNINLGDKLVKSELRPYMRKKDIVYKATGLKPISTCYPFFDNDSIQKYVKAYNYITLNSNNLGYFDDTAHPELVIIKENGVTLGYATAILKSRNKLYIDPVKQPDFVGPLAEGQYPTFSNIEQLLSNTVAWSTNASSIFVQGTRSGFNVNVSATNSFVFRSGNVNTSVTPTTTSFKLPPEAANSVFTYVAGSTPVRIVDGTGKGQNSVIDSYNPTTRIVTLDPTKPLTVAPTGNTIFQIGDITTDLQGRVAGKFYMPNGVFHAGEKKFRLLDSSTGEYELATSRADSPFFAEGILETVQAEVISTIKAVKKVQTITETQVVKRDPLAETFYVDPSQYPNGLFLSKLRLCFKRKDDEMPVSIEIRPTENGYPSSTIVYPFSEVSLTPDEVNITNFPDLDDETKYTEFVFQSPVYLTPGEHSVIVLSNSNEYEAWIAVKNQKDVNTNNSVSNEPYTGSFFKSQNGLTWTADQESDLMFRLYKKSFDDTVETNIRFKLNSNDIVTELGTANANVDILILQTQDIKLNGCEINYSFNAEDINGTKTGFIEIEENVKNYMLDSFGKRVINPSHASDAMYVEVSMTTTNSDVSPVVDLDRMNIQAIEQVINNLEISNSTITMSNTGYYTNTTHPSPITITISGGGGTGATATANIINNGTSNTIDKIIITNPGYGYKTQPNITISGGLNTYPAIAFVNTEDQKRFGNAKARYTTKKVVLADGFSSGDLRVYLVAHKPAQSSIDVYYKLLSNGDQELWQDKKWQLMTQINEQGYYSESFDDFAELTFAPGLNGVANNSVSYISDTSGQFTEFNTFAIKIVLSGVDSIDVPRVQSLRAIALPSA